MRRTRQGSQGFWGEKKRWGLLLLGLCCLVLAGAKGGCGGSVCDFNGKVYQTGDSFPSADGCNTCSCADSGQVVCTRKACTTACGGTTNATCDKDSFCGYPTGSCGKDAKVDGSCQPKPGNCTTQYDPVCGCDGNTYGNNCGAAAAGVNVASKGKCSTSSGQCTYEGKTYQDGDTFMDKDNCNSCQCQKGQVGCTVKACYKPCEYDGKTYKQGETYPAKDGCNQCQCLDGQSTCTKKSCPPVGCKYDGKDRKEGETFPATDGCNTCTCTGGSVSCTKKNCPPIGCTYEGKTYKEGETFPAGDNCNTCTCTNGSPACTKKACPPAGCKYDGKEYKEGEKFPATDGCNSCVCNNGQVGCTEKACPKTCKYNGKVYQEGDSFPASDGCNTCGCQNGVAACTKRGCVSCGSRGLKPCRSGEYCNQPGHCGATDIPGSCLPMPNGCTKQLDPVCGCDNKNYGNPCMAAAAGVSVVSKGKCPTKLSCKYNSTVYPHGTSFKATDGCNTCNCTDGQVACTKKACVQSCGSRGLKPCPSEEYCNQPGHCGATDIPGTCAEKTKGCPRNIDWVCGCDGNTYSNPCTAASAGVSVVKKGKCSPTP